MFADTRFVHIRVCVHTTPLYENNDMNMYFALCAISSVDAYAYAYVW